MEEKIMAKSKKGNILVGTTGELLHEINKILPHRTVMIIGHAGIGMEY